MEQVDARCPQALKSPAEDEVNDLFSDSDGSGVVSTSIDPTVEL